MSVSPHQGLPSTWRSLESYPADVRRSIEDIERYIYSKPPSRGHGAEFDSYLIGTTSASHYSSAIGSRGIGMDVGGSPKPSRSAARGHDAILSPQPEGPQSLDFLDVVHFLRCRYGDSTREHVAGRELSTLSREDALSLVECFRQELLESTTSTGEPSLPVTALVAATVAPPPPPSATPHSTSPGPPRPLPINPRESLNASEKQLLLKKGEMFVKFGRRGAPKIRYVCLRDFAGISSMTWTSDPRSSPHGQLPMHTLRRVEKGATSPVFSRHIDVLSRRPIGPRGVPVDEQCCFSLYFDSRTIDLCASDATPEASMQVAAQWVMALNSMVSKKQ